MVDKAGRAIAGIKGAHEYDSPELIALLTKLAAR